jgi:hypothetical protein
MISSNWITDPQLPPPHQPTNHRPPAPTPHQTGPTSKFHFCNSPIFRQHVIKFNFLKNPWEIMNVSQGKDGSLNRSPSPHLQQTHPPTFTADSKIESGVGIGVGAESHIQAEEKQYKRYSNVISSSSSSSSSSSVADTQANANVRARTAVMLVGDSKTTAIGMGMADADGATKQRIGSFENSELSAAFNSHPHPDKGDVHGNGEHETVAETEAEVWDTNTYKSLPKAGDGRQLRHISLPMPTPLPEDTVPWEVAWKSSKLPTVVAARRALIDHKVNTENLQVSLMSENDTIIDEQSLARYVVCSIPTPIPLFCCPIPK